MAVAGVVAFAYSPGGAASPAMSSIVSQAVRYTALGDSYSAGVGTGDYSNRNCDDSPEGYPPLWRGSHTVATFRFVACGGATTADVLNSQLKGLSPDTTLVTITIGGNDVGFSNILFTCYLHGQRACLDGLASAESYAHRTLPGLLARTYSRIRSVAPRARVVVLGYPHLYGADLVCLDTLSGTEHNALDHGADVLDGVIAAAVRQAGPGFVFADVRPYFNGHGICSFHSWVNGLLGFSKGAFHPTSTGYKDGYLPALERAVR